MAHCLPGILVLNRLVLQTIFFFYVVHQGYSNVVLLCKYTRVIYNRLAINFCINILVHDLWSAETSAFFVQCRVASS